MKFPRFNRHLHPQGGRYFVDEDGVTHRGDSWPALATRVINYRKRAGKPPGDPRAEIEAQVCARQPQYCQADPPAPTRRQEAPDSPRSSTKAITRWLVSILKLRRIGGAQQVPREEARRRAAICAVCPKQKAFSSVCGSCKAMRKTTKQILFGGSSSVGERLKGCSVLSEDTSTSVHIQQDPSGNPGLPENCWRK